MAPIKRFLLLLLLSLSALWWLGDGMKLTVLPENFFAWRSVLMQYSGVLGIGLMSVAMLLALRPVRFEPWLGGLDKMYRLHKWLGIGALIVAVAHWLLAQGPKWLIGLGLLSRPPRGPRPQIPAEEALRAFFASQRGPAESVGEWAFYGAALLMVLALVKRFPYRWFFKTHRLIAIGYLALVWHSVVLLKFDSWASPLGVAMALLMASGSVAAVIVLLRRVALQRQVVGEVERVETLPALDVLAVGIRLQGRWSGHQAGQFAFVTLHEDEGAHPYTITSAWLDDGHISFVIKALGDYTRTLAERVKVGDVVRIEGPYGRFNFEGPTTRQIWIGGGIGITPFIARMKALAQQPDGRAVDLIHTTAVHDERAMALLRSDAQAAGVNLQVLWDQRDGRLDAQRLTQMLPHWRDADVWFCGPAAFGRSLRQDLIAMGLPAECFHQELFEMR